MSEQNNGQTGTEGSDVSGPGPWKRRFGLIGIFTLALLFLPALPPWLRVIAAAIPAWAVLEGFDLLPRLRARWPRLISELPNDDERRARWGRLLGLIGLVAAAFILLPPLPPRMRLIAFAVAMILAALGALGAFPTLRATCQRWLASLGITSPRETVRRADAPRHEGGQFQATDPSKVQ
jgi:hypothetical protein